MAGGSPLRLLVLAGFIVVVAVALWFADVDRPLVVLGIALAWAIAAVYEWVSWRPPRTRWAPPDQPAFDRRPPPPGHGPARTLSSPGLERRAPGPATTSRRARARTPASGRGGETEAARAKPATAGSDSPVNQDGEPERGRERARGLGLLGRREPRSPARQQDAAPEDLPHDDKETEPTPAAPGEGPVASPERPDTVAEGRGAEPRPSPPPEPASAPAGDVERREAGSDGRPEKTGAEPREGTEAPAPVPDAQREPERARVAGKLGVSAPSSPARSGVAPLRPVGASPRPVSTASPPEDEPAAVRPERTAPASADAPVARLPEPSSEPREWNVWELERLAREESAHAPARGEEWSYLFLYLRQFAQPGGSLPAEFDRLVRESFVELLDRADPA